MFLKKRGFGTVPGGLVFATLLAVLLVFTGCPMGNDDDDNDNQQQQGYDPAAGLDWTKLAAYDASEDPAGYVLGTASAEISSGDLVVEGTYDIRYKETALGNLIADGMAEYAQYASGQTIDFALHNAQNVRGLTSIPAGEIKLANLSAGLGDTLYLVKYTGAEVKAIIDTFVNSNTAGSWKGNGVVLVSHGVQYTITPSDTPNDPPHATDIKVNGSPIDPEKKYLVAVGNFIGDVTVATRFPVGEKLDDAASTALRSIKLQAAVAYYILAKGTISPVVESRITGEVPAL